MFALFTWFIESIYSKLQFHVQFKFEEQLNCMRGHSEINKIEFDPIFGVNIYT